MKNIFVFGLDDFNLEQLRTIRNAEDYRFHPLFQYREVKAGPTIPAAQLLEEGWDRLSQFPGPIDAIVGYWDFPVSTMLPLLRKPFGLPSPSFEAVLKCEHKYWSRLEQADVIPQVTPRFCLIDPFSKQPAKQIDLPFPFWLKPIKAVSSILGFRIESDEDLHQALQRIRAEIKRFSEPFDYLLQYAQLPPHIDAVRGYHCLAEEIISSGRQFTLEGYVHNQQTHVYGVVDSMREGAHMSSFARYQYPSTVPTPVQQRTIDIVSRFLRHIDYDQSPFNAEFFWDEQHDEIKLLEVNTRISKSHTPLFKHVDGAYHHQVMVESALGQAPVFPHRQGEYPVAAKFMWRLEQDAFVSHVPSQAQVREIEQRIPGVRIQVFVKDGMRLSDLRDQDSYSYEVAVFFVGGQSSQELEEKYQRCKEALDLRFETTASRRDDGASVSTPERKSKRLP